MPFRTFPPKFHKKSAPSGSLFSESESDAKRQASCPEFIVAYIDGGARGNPGPAGYGARIEDAQRKVIAELSEFLGHKTNNFAEYSALIAALEYAVAHQRRSLKVVSDSELLVKQLRGEYKVKSPDLKALYDQARGLIRHLDHFEIRHVLRAQNRDADRLANAAMDRGMNRGGAPPVKPSSPASAARSYNGIVRAGVVELLEGELPEGTMVKVTPVRKL